MSEPLTRLTTGMPVVFGGDRVTFVPDDLAAAFHPGDRLVVVQQDGALLHVPGSEHDRVDRAVRSAHQAFSALATVGDDAVSAFYDAFARLLADDETCRPILAANEADIASARARGRSTTRLVLSERMRADMVEGLHAWRDTSPLRDAVLERLEHPGWRVEQRRAPLGVVGFVFEGRPNVLADGTGVLRSGNTAVLRIGRDALGTALAVVEHALTPALLEAGLPADAVRLLDTPDRAAGWALFSHPLLALAVARGSGEAVAQLGAVARQAGIPVSLHGTGGAWIVAGLHADHDRFANACVHSLDRKVCNTLNVCCIPASRAGELVPRFLDAIERAAQRRGTVAKLHVAQGSQHHVPPEWFERSVPIRRADGEHSEPQAEVLDDDGLGTEWEWEDSPEVTLAVVDGIDDAIELFNRHSPRLVASLVSDDDGEHDRFWTGIDAPFVGNGFTRWVDGQFALHRPELGLSNWQHGRLLARSAVLSGDSVYTVRTRAVQDDPHLHR
jgi:glutamate-5-semialdehyde dehydrogenase